MKASMAAELADMFAMVMLLADHQGIDIEQAVTDKWFKYLDRE